MGGSGPVSTPWGISNMRRHCTSHRHPFAAAVNGIPPRDLTISSLALNLMSQHGMQVYHRARACTRVRRYISTPIRRVSPEVTLNLRQATTIPVGDLATARDAQNKRRRPRTRAMTSAARPENGSVYTRHTPRRTRKSRHLRAAFSKQPTGGRGTQRQE